MNDHDLIERATRVLQRRGDVPEWEYGALQAFQTEAEIEMLESFSEERHGECVDGETHRSIDVKLGTHQLMNIDIAMMMALSQGWELVMTNGTWKTPIMRRLKR